MERPAGRAALASRGAWVRAGEVGDRGLCQWRAEPARDVGTQGPDALARVRASSGAIGCRGSPASFSANISPRSLDWPIATRSFAPSLTTISTTAPPPTWHSRGVTTPRNPATPLRAATDSPTLSTPCSVEGPGVVALALHGGPRQRPRPGARAARPGPGWRLPGTRIRPAADRRRRAPGSTSLPSLLAAAGSFPRKAGGAPIAPGIARPLPPHTRRQRSPSRLRRPSQPGLPPARLAPNARGSWTWTASPRPSATDTAGTVSGQGVLAGPSPTEAEVPLITVVWNHSARGQDKHEDDIETYGWDTHNDIFAQLFIASTFCPDSTGARLAAPERPRRARVARSNARRDHG